MPINQCFPSIENIKDAADRIRQYIHQTPVITCSTLNRITGAEIFFKCENFQKAGAFKFRGACNAVFSLSNKEAAKGVATHSSGNHAQALALAAKIRGIPAHIVMPRNAAGVKRKAAADYGANITFCEPTLESREETIEKKVKETGAVFIHPYNNNTIIAGQGTAALELLEKIPGLDIVMTPVGGGGLLSGAAIVISQLSPSTQVIGVEPVIADDAFRSLQEGKIVPSQYPMTIADGLRTSLGTLTFPIIQKFVNKIVTVSEEAIIEAMRLMWERTKIIIEPSSAVPLAALLNKKHEFSDRKIGIIISGGNIDFDNLPF
jgi:threonine dehydratase